MNALEIEFLDEYKMVDAICGDMYSVRSGVSEYISQMELVPVSEQYMLASWTNDYKMLKRLRGLRNCIVHDSSESMCEEADLYALKEFHFKLLNAQDPLAVLNHLKKKRPSESYFNESARYESRISPNSEKQLEVLIGIAVGLALFTIVFVLLVIGRL